MGIATVSQAAARAEKRTAPLASPFQTGHAESAESELAEYHEHECQSSAGVGRGTRAHYPRAPLRDELAEDRTADSCFERAEASLLALRFLLLVLLFVG